MTACFPFPQNSAADRPPRTAQPTTYTGERTLVKPVAECSSVPHRASRARRHRTNHVSRRPQPRDSSANMALGAPRRQPLAAARAIAFELAAATVAESSRPPKGVAPLESRELGSGRATRFAPVRRNSGWLAAPETVRAAQQPHARPPFQPQSLLLSSSSCPFFSAAAASSKGALPDHDHH